MNEVRVAGRADLPRLVELMIEFYAEAGLALAAGAAGRAFEGLLGDARLGRVWMMECGTVPAGYAVLTVAYSMEYAGLHGFVDDLFVRKAYRGRGLASAALAEVRRCCEALGVRALHVEAGPQNGPAQRVYRRAGFEETGRQLLTLPLAPPTHLA